jgi:hypothetical protein
MRLILRTSSIAQECRCCRAHRAPSAADRVGSHMETRYVYFSDIGCAIRPSKFIFLSRRTDLKPPLPTTFLCTCSLLGKDAAAAALRTFSRLCERTERFMVIGHKLVEGRTRPLPLGRPLPEGVVGPTDKDVDSVTTGRCGCCW